MRSRHARTLARVRERPTRSDITWREIDAMLRSLGAELSERAGSRVRVSLHGRAAVVHRPHPEKELTKSVVESLRRFLGDAGVE